MTKTISNRMAKAGNGDGECPPIPAVKTAVNFQLAIIQAIAELVRESQYGRSEGEIYAMLLPVAPQITAEYFSACVAVLVRAGAIKRTNNYLTWAR